MGRQDLVEVDQAEWELAVVDIRLERSHRADQVECFRLAKVLARVQVGKDSAWILEIDHYLLRLELLDLKTASCAGQSRRTILN